LVALTSAVVKKFHLPECTKVVLQGQSTSGERTAAFHLSLHVVVRARLHEFTRDLYPCSSHINSASIHACTCMGRAKRHASQRSALSLMIRNWYRHTCMSKVAQETLMLRGDEDMANLDRMSTLSAKLRWLRKTGEQEQLGGAGKRKAAHRDDKQNRKQSRPRRPCKKSYQLQQPGQQLQQPGGVFRPSSAFAVGC